MPSPPLQSGRRQAGDVRVIATAAIRDPLNAVLKQAEAVIGKPIVAEYTARHGAI